MIRAEFFGQLGSLKKLNDSEKLAIYEQILKDLEHFKNDCDFGINVKSLLSVTGEIRRREDVRKNRSGEIDGTKDSNKAN